MPAKRQASDKPFTLQIPRNSLKIAGIAFGVGVALFVAVWLSNRDSGFYRADPATQTPQQTAELAPLPEPLAAAAGSSDMPDARPTPAADSQAPELVDETPALVETPPSVPADAAPPAGVPANAAPQPIAGQSPPPEYPAGAQRRGETGSVVVRADIDATGYPNNIVVVQRSGSRDLDRAASDAVRRWRFTPAIANGQPVPGSIEVPFDFNTSN